MEIKYPVRCPLMNNNEISMDECFDIHMVVEGHTPKWTAPDEIYKYENYVDICNNCKFHRED